MMDCLNAIQGRNLNNIPTNMARLSNTQCWIWEEIKMDYQGKKWKNGETLIQGPFNLIEVYGYQ